jgi:flagella synthesis protein FlgN
MNALLLIKILLQGIRADNQHYSELLALLEEQRAALIKHQHTDLEEINNKALHLYEHLRQSVRERQQVLLRLGVKPDNVGINQIFDRLPLPQKESARYWWLQLERQIRTCKKNNERNGLLLNMQQRLIEQLIGLQKSPLYSEYIPD